MDVEVEAYDPDDVVVDDPSLTRKGRNKYVTEAWKTYKAKNGNETKRAKAGHQHLAARAASRMCWQRLPHRQRPARRPRRRRIDPPVADGGTHSRTDALAAGRFNISVQPAF